MSSVGDLKVKEQHKFVSKYYSVVELTLMSLFLWHAELDRLLNTFFYRQTILM